MPYYFIAESSHEELLNRECEADDWEEAIDSLLEISDLVSEYESPVCYADYPARRFVLTKDGKRETIVIYRLQGEWEPFPNPHLKDCHRLSFNQNGLEIRVVVWKESSPMMDCPIWRAGVQPGGIPLPSFIYPWNDVCSEDSLLDVKTRVEELCYPSSSNEEYPAIKFNYKEVYYNLTDQLSHRKPKKK